MIEWSPAIGPGVDVPGAPQNLNWDFCSPKGKSMQRPKGREKEMVSELKSNEEILTNTM